MPTLIFSVHTASTTQFVMPSDVTPPIDVVSKKLLHVLGVEAETKGMRCDHVRQNDDPADP